MSDSNRTARVTAKARKSIMSNVQYIPHSYQDTTSPTASKGEGSDSSGNVKKLPQDLPMHMDLTADAPSKAQTSGVAADKVKGGGDSLGGGPKSKSDQDAGSSGPLDKQHKSADPTSMPSHDSRGGSDGGSANADSKSADSVDKEDGESGASRGKDLLGPSLPARSKTVRALMGAYKKSQ